MLIFPKIYFTYGESPKIRGESPKRWKDNVLDILNSPAVAENGQIVSPVAEKKRGAHLDTPFIV